MVEIVISIKICSILLNHCFFEDRGFSLKKQPAKYIEIFRLCNSPGNGTQMMIDTLISLTIIKPPEGYRITEIHCREPKNLVPDNVG